MLTVPIEKRKKNVSIGMPSKNQQCREFSFSVKLQNIIINLPTCIKIFLVITMQNHGEGWSQRKQRD